jgi:hypothetical protein
VKNFVLAAAGAVVFAVGIMGGAFDARASLIQVAQESSANAGDFDANVLGSIDPFNTGMTAAGLYQYGSPNASSYNGELNGGPDPVSSLSQVFMVEASDGLTLVVVHDRPNDGSGGSTVTRWNLTGDTAAQVVADDPGEPLTVSMGGTQFDSTKNWIACCTDGYAIGFLEADWTLLGQFLTVPTGITNWAVVSADLSSVPLTLSPGRRVRLQQIPEPATLGLLLFGLAGVAWGARRRMA